MKLRVCISFLIYFVWTAFGVEVKLKDNNGNTAAGLVAREGLQDETISLDCNFSPSANSGGTPSIEWIFQETLNNPAQYLIVLNGIVQNKYTSSFSLDYPATLVVSPAKKEDKESTYSQTFAEHFCWTVISQENCSVDSVQSRYTNTRGFYTCQVTNPVDVPSRGSGTYNLTVNVPPSKPSCRYTSDYALTVGNSAEFRCQSLEGIPSPQYNWYKDEKLLPTKAQDHADYKNTSFVYNKATGTITFTKVVAGDAGEYYCEAFNKVGKKQCKAVRITTKEQNVGMIIGIVFAVVFFILLVAVLAWWTWRKGYCSDGVDNGEDDNFSSEGEGAGDMMMESHGPIVRKPPSEYSASTGKNSLMYEGAVRVMP